MLGLNASQVDADQLPIGPIGTLPSCLRICRCLAALKCLCLRLDAVKAFVWFGCQAKDGL